MIKVYFSASFPRAKDIEKMKSLLGSNTQVTSSWHKPGNKNHYKDTFNKFENLKREGIRDIKELYESDVLIQLIGDDLSQGGRHAEFGFMCALRRPIILITDQSDKEHLEHVLQYGYWDKLYLLSSITCLEPFSIDLNPLVNILKVLQNAEK